MSDLLDVYNELPDGLLEATVETLHQILPRPSLIHLQGDVDAPLFLSTLLHGNETTGFYAVQKLLRHYLQSGKSLPRSVSFFIGNIKAAELGLRRLDEQADYNRIWPGTHQHYLAEAHMMQQVTDIMRDRKPFASIDIHNNTGKNPHYACINKLQTDFVTLAGLFSHTLVYFTTPKGVQSAAFAEFCPAVTLECGLSGEAGGVEHAFRFIDAVLDGPNLCERTPEHLRLFHTVARVNIPDGYSFGFEQDATINLLPEIEDYNFRELSENTLLATTEPGSSAYLQAYDDDEREVGRDFFEYHEDNIVLKRDVMPAMLTMDTRIIRQDCLCYLMERISLDKVTDCPDQV